MNRKFLLVAGARPNFMKIVPILRALQGYPQIDAVLLHTGQHYDFEMSEAFFKNFGIPEPDVFLNVGSGSHATQTAQIMLGFERIVLEQQPELVIVVGDVNSTIACALVAAKMGIKVAHVEAGLRSFDQRMPEEINRILTDSLSDYLFVTEQSGIDNLAREGIKAEKVHFVGNVMIDTLLAYLQEIEEEGLEGVVSQLPDKYGVVTMHRASNVDSPEALSKVVSLLEEVAQKSALLYPVHPRSKKMLEKYQLYDRLAGARGVHLVAPLDYFRFMKAVKGSMFVLTDSGGIQEETTVLNVPCLTMRENTERPATIEEGTNRLVGRDRDLIMSSIEEILAGNWRQVDAAPRFWDGQAAVRIAKILDGLDCPVKPDNDTVRKLGNDSGDNKRV